MLERMLENGHILGGKSPGLIIMLEYNTTGDGQVIAISLRDNEENVVRVCFRYESAPAGLKKRKS